MRSARSFCRTNADELSTRRQYDYATREPNYEDTGITENTRCAYPIEHIANSKIPCMSSSQPSNVIYVRSCSLLTPANEY